MDNYDISKILGVYAKLYELHGGNPFKIKSIAAAAFNIKKVGEPLFSLSDEQLAINPQVSKTILPKIIELKNTGTIQELEDLYLKTPKGILDILKIKGLGPKKVEVLWKEYDITSVIELAEACRENRLVEMKGFGLKTQDLILKNIEFLLNQEGKLHWAKAEKIANDILEKIKEIPSVLNIQNTGSFRRLNETIDNIDFVVELDNIELFIQSIISDELILTNKGESILSFLFNENFEIKFHLAKADNFEQILFETTATPEHLKIINYQLNGAIGKTEIQIYESLNLPFILPELREGLSELNHLNFQNRLIKYEDLKGVIHNHSTYSDGLDTLKVMADFAKELNFEYLVICDHSQTAIYANGLKPDKVLQQFLEIDSLNKSYKNFKIFKGIESDILSDGSLDYENSLLSEFDVVVSSIHSNLTMDLEKANTRLVKAIENPFTRILGHPTGRLLLMREGYPIDYKYILDACIANNVVVELNAHPYRLDIDWRYISYLIDKGGMISINPDAHQKQGYWDMKYGVNVARKGYLMPENCLNAMNLEEFSNWVNNKK